MDRLTELLDASAPPARVVGARLDEVTTRITRKRPSRRLILVAGTITLMLGGATAAAAATGTLQDIIDDALGTHSDHSWAMDITVRGEVWACTGGVAVLPATTKADYVEADYLAVKRFIQEHDWSDLRPDESLLGSRFKTAETLAITADRHMTLVAQQAGLSLSSTEARGFASCEKK